MSTRTFRWRAARTHAFRHGLITALLLPLGGLAEARAQVGCPGGFPQAPFPLECAESAVTCFSGFVQPFNPGSGLDPAGFVMAVIDNRDPAANSPGNGVNWCAPAFHNEYSPSAPSEVWNAANLGQVFGITLDGANPPSIYVTTTSAYGSDDPTVQIPGATATLSTPHFGPGGSGAVYRIDGTSADVTTFAALPNDGPGLGQICFDEATGRLYVSNHADGRIYCLDGAGTTVSTFDHASGLIVSGGAAEPGDAPNFVPLGERVWAVQTFEGRLYYSLWWEDRGRNDPVEDNEIWSIDISGGTFAGAAQQEIPAGIPHMEGNWSNPVSDIAFSSDGRMMLAERNMQADVGPGGKTVTGNDGHRARNLEYVFNGTDWVATAPPGVCNFCIGVSPSGPGTNAAGGIGFDCDDNLWSTGDQLLTTPDVVYGLQRTPAAGNTVGTIASTGYFIDLDGDTSPGSVQTKSRIGDVEVYNECCQCVVIVEERVDCIAGDGFRFTFSVTNESNVAIHHMLVVPDPPATVSPDVVSFSPPIAPGETREINLVFSGLEGGMEGCFLLAFLDEEIQECCTIEHCIKPCMQVVSDVTCAPGAGRYLLTLTITNLFNGPLEHIFLIPPLNSGITFTPDHFDVPTVDPCATVVVQTTVNVPAGVSEFCFLLTAHDQFLEQCCGEEVCIELPPCAATGCCIRCDGTSFIVTQAECDMLGGYYCGDDTDCAACPPLPSGACCVPGLPCFTTTLCGCDGQFFPGLGCDKMPCGPPPECAGDCNGDLIVDVQDLVAVVIEWGPCPAPCPSDFNDDGVINVQDMVQVILNWGPCP